MKRVAGRSVFLGALLLAALPGARAEGFEVTPMLGFHFNSDLTDIDPPEVERLEIQEAGGWGLILGYQVRTDGWIEFLYSRQETQLRGHGLAFPAGGETLSDLTLETYHIGGIYEALENEEKNHPFVGFSVGVSRYAPSSGSNSMTNFSFSVYGGGKFMFGKHAGLRLQARWTPTFIASDTAVYCRFPGSCYALASGDVSSDIELSSGLILRF